jgi:AbiU2
VCNQAYAGWRIHKILFDDNPRKKELERSEARHALMHFSIVSQESLLLQIAKLHDPAIMQGHITLGVEYMVRYGGWDKSTETELQTLQVQLNELAMKIRPARHKILSQNDLEAILSGATLGEFPDGEDNKYFKTLQEFMDVIHTNIIGEALPFSEDARITKEFLWFFREEACKDQPIHI